MAGKVSGHDRLVVGDVVQVRPLSSVPTVLQGVRGTVSAVRAWQPGFPEPVVSVQLDGWLSPALFEPAELVVVSPAGPCVQCAECGRRFDLGRPADADEWTYGHDCEAA